MRVFVDSATYSYSLGDYLRYGTGSGRAIPTLLGYELVEGTVKNGHMREIRRASYAPLGLSASR